MASASKTKVVKTKDKCCKSGPRCEKCPVVWQRLAEQGYAERTGKRTFEVIQVVPRKKMTKARKRARIKR